MKSWREVWRNGFAKVLPREGLKRLLAALESDDRRLVQGKTTHPNLLACVHDWPIECGCPVAFCWWQGGGLTTVGDVSEAFAKACFDADQLLGEPAACRWFLNWVDDTPRDEMRAHLIPEVRLALGIQE